MHDCIIMYRDLAIIIALLMHVTIQYFVIKQKFIANLIQMQNTLSI